MVKYLVNYFGKFSVDNQSVMYILIYNP